ncbi:MAG: AraC family transcriptional regulator [Haliea sp.]|nr:MAG: AraC family transcriptional regulator [Haliea sp.]
MPLAEKRGLLEQLHARHGARTLLRLGEGIRDARDEPALTALGLARDPHDLVARWQRLERYVHSRHSIEVESASADCMVLRHVSKVPAEPPRASEDLLVIGLLVALAERIGTPALGVCPDSEPSWSYSEGAWPLHSPALADSSRWRLSWEQGARPAEASRDEQVDLPQAAYRLLADDPSQRWTLKALATHLGTSSRSLQRHLRMAGHSFSSLWTEARLARSAELLTGSRQSPAEVGYVCGFADQAHFTRLFKLHTSMTPVRYREQFAPRSA